MNYLKVFFAIVLTSYSLYYLNTLNEWHFIDNVNLVIHEGGHVLFMPFGELLMLLGGTILQLFIPIVFAVYFYAKGQNFSASVMVFWLAINFWNVSIYAGDALTRDLPLITGDPDTHDWNQILFILGWLKHTTTISWIFYWTGILTMISETTFEVLSARKPKIDPFISTRNY